MDTTETPPGLVGDWVNGPMIRPGATFALPSCPSMYRSTARPGTLFTNVPVIGAAVTSVVAVAVVVNVAVAVAVSVLSGVLVGVLVGVSVGVLVGVSVAVLVGVSVGVAVLVAVLVGVSVLVGVFVGVSVGVLVGVFVGVSVGVLVGSWPTVTPPDAAIMISSNTVSGRTRYLRICLTPSQLNLQCDFLR